MLNDPTPDNRRPHPLEQRPQPPSRPRQQVMLHIRSVRPTATYVLLVVNIVIFFVRAISVPVDRDVFEWGANIASRVMANGEYYRLFTSMFLHAGIFGPFGSFEPSSSLHLIFNMYILYAVGTSLERLFGHTRFLIIYLLGGLAGSVLSALGAVIGGFDSASVGASGAVFAILGAEFIYLVHHRRLLGQAGRSRRQNLLIFGAINLLFGLVSTLPGSQMRIDNWAHIGGLIGGIVLAWYISPILTLKPHPDRPGEILGEDTNPLNRNLTAVSFFATALVILVFVGTRIARG